MSKSNSDSAKSSHIYPPRLDKTGAQQYISNEHFPISLRKLERLLPTVDRVYVGRTPLFETIALAAFAKRLIQEGSSTARNVPPPRPRKRQASA